MEETITIEEMTRRLFKMKDTYVKEIKRELPTAIGNAAVNIFVENFAEQGFDTGAGVQKWKEVKRRIPEPQNTNTQKQGS